MPGALLELQRFGSRKSVSFGSRDGPQGASPSGQRAAKRDRAISREQKYWYAMEVAPLEPSRNAGGYSTSRDAASQSAPSGQNPELRKMLEQIQEAKATRQGPPENVVGTKLQL